MKVTKMTKTVTYENKLIAIKCNKCGKTINEEKDGCESFEFEGGYDGHLVDGGEYKFDLCHNCLINFMNKFKYPALIKKLW